MAIKQLIVEDLEGILENGSIKMETFKEGERLNLVDHRTMETCLVRVIGSRATRRKNELELFVDVEKVK